MAQTQKDQRRRKAMEDKARKRSKSPKGRDADSRKSTLKEKIAYAFSMERPSKKPQPIPGVKPKQPGRSIHQLSFMDTKMGQYADDVQMSEYISRDLETKSDLGNSSKRKSSWAGKDLPNWYNETLSASTLRRNKKMLDNKFTASTPNLLDTSEPTAQRHRGESYSEFDADIVKKEKRKGIFSRFKFWKSTSKKQAQRNKASLTVSSECIDVPL